MDADYRKDLSHTTWQKVYNRQVERAAQAAQWLDALQLQPGQRLLDVGSGPGYVSSLAAARVGPRGRVYAVDRSAEALAFLEHLQREEGAAQIQRIVADATAMDPLPEPVDAALVTMMLHHADDGQALLRNVARLLPPGARAVVAEFDPEGPCEHGPPRDHRLSPDQVRSWCEAAGLQIEAYQPHPPEQYMFLVRRT